MSFTLTKRQKIIAASILMTVGIFLATHSVNFIFHRSRLVLILGAVSYFFSIWALWEGMTRLKAIILLILPVMYTIAITSFYFLLPSSWLTKVLIPIVFGISFYFLLLSQNVFNVASIRTIPLYRAAATASFLFALLTCLFLFNVLYALHLPFYLNGLIIFLITFLIALQNFWSIEMERITSVIVVYSLVVALVVAEVGMGLSFLPVISPVWALYLCISIYILCGIITEYIRNRVTGRVAIEYLGVGLSVVVISYFLFNFLANFWVELGTLSIPS